MRSKSSNKNGYTIYAVSGINTISFAIDFLQANTKGLLGFAVERIDKTWGSRKFVNGFKVFKDDFQNPDAETQVNTYNYPVQSFVWDDFTCYANSEYEYLFYPLKGKPGNIDRSEKPVSVKIKTEPLFSNLEHDVFFNRGVASSQAYQREFHNLAPDDITDPVLKQKALDWLSRFLDEAILKFINQAKSGETLLGCFYEFRYQPVVDAFKKAIDRGVNVKIIIDAKNKITKDKQGNPQDPFPRKENLDVIDKAGISSDPADGIIFRREARQNAIQHNKFIVYINKSGNAQSVWTGSTNISDGGIHGQTNVGHWLRNKDVAEKFVTYWNLLSTDPGSQKGDDATTARKKNDDFRKAVVAIQGDIPFTSWDDIPVGVTPVFSPRKGLTMMDTYVQMLDNAAVSANITLAFGINKRFKNYLADNTVNNAITFMLLEKKDKPSATAKTPFIIIGANQNVYKAWGSYLKDSLYNWTRETSTRHLQLNQHVAYIHSKFLLVDPLTADPVVVTGSANFSDPSTTENDENMLIIRGNQRVADIYFTEFNRLFNHYYFRAVYENSKNNNTTDEASIFLSPDDSWLKKYKKGGLKYKKIEMYANMEGFEK